MLSYRWPCGLLAAALIAAPFAPSPARATMPPLVPDLAPGALTEAFHSGLLAGSAPSEGLPTSATRGNWKIPVILASFSDTALAYGPADFERLLFDSTGAVPTGSAYDYYRWVSHGQLSLRGKVVAQVKLPNSRAYYGNNSSGLSGLATPNNEFGFVWDAIRACPASINWADYDLDHDGYVDMLWVVHPGVGGETTADKNALWSLTSALTNGWRSGTFFATDDPIPGSPSQTIRLDRFTVLPELSPFVPGAISEIGAYCHEFGHCLGLPDLYTVALFTGQIDMGPGNWSLMSSGAYGTDGHSPQFPSHMGAWPLQFLRWDTTFRPSVDSTIALAPLEEGGPILDLWFQGEAQPEHFLIENRARLGFDRNLPSPGLIVYHVDDNMIFQRLLLNSINSGPTPGLRLMEADGRFDLPASHNRGDATDPFPGALGRVAFDDDTQPSTRTFLGGWSNVALTNIQLDGNFVRFRARVQPAGWRPVQDFTSSGFQPIESFGQGRAMDVDANGVAYWVTSEVRDGRPQVVLRSGRGEWGDPLPVSYTTREALDPTVAVLPGGDLGIVWSDDRSGTAQLYYRSRIRGVWSAEHPLVPLPGDCRYPSVSADHHGMMSVAFRYSGPGSNAQIRLLRFSYAAPFGQPVPVTSSPLVPGPPLVLTAPNGATTVLWIERSTTPQRLYFARWAPDSGVVGPYALTPRPAQAQLTFGGTIDRFGTIHVAWQMSGAGRSEIHYQRRFASQAPSPWDTILDARGTLLQNPAIAADAGGNLHLVYESTPTTAIEVRYLNQRAGTWDALSSVITSVNQGSASRPQPLPSTDKDLSVAFTQYAADGVHIRLRRRVLGPEQILTVPEPPEAASPIALRAGPNPVRAGRGLEVWWSGAAPSRPAIELFDVAGRKVAEANLARGGAGWRAGWSGAATREWPEGVLFARVAGTSASTRIVVVR